MSMQKVPTLSSDSEEESFGSQEVFISRTDSRGIIRSGNSVFKRVSGYEWDQLIGAPHRVIRHPETPKAVFWLLWAQLAKGEPVVAFVKNISKSGRWYWVLASVVPVQGGYISGRIKPIGAIYEQTRALYGELLLAEQGGLSPEKSAGLLLSKLTDLGYASYADFSARALEEALEARVINTLQKKGSQALSLKNVLDNMTAMASQQNLLMQDFERLQTIPTNMRIIASRLEPSGGPISAISDNYKYSLTEITRKLESFAGNENNLSKTASIMTTSALLVSGIVRVLSEIQHQLAEEDLSQSPIDKAAELQIVTIAEQLYSAKSDAEMLNAERLVTEMNLASGEIRRMMLGLDTIRVMGRVESGRRGGAAGTGLSSTIDQLDARHGEITDRLQRLMDISSAIKTAISAFRRQERLSPRLEVA
ncbi:MAG: PAS domain-containing protein [Cypionkella sp.]